MARVVYLTGWSQDEQGKSRQPHLGTIDAVVLPLMALSAQGRRDVEGTRYEHAYVSQIDVRAGSAPWLDLEAETQLPVTMTSSSGIESAAFVGLRIEYQFFGVVQTFQEIGR
ncbi:AvrD family protein [Rathayibacter iranicus]|uniref:AvrD family protein n=1 Tax=Rathayibacter iranicus TaxID=59737 RepID=UPI003B019D0B